MVALFVSAAVVGVMLIIVMQKGSLSAHGARRMFPPTIFLEDNISFSFYFTRKAFFHLLGLEKLNKLYEFKGKSKQIIYNEILNGTFPIAAHRKSQPIQKSC